MRYGSVCSGIEAASVAWKGLGWCAAWFSEIESFPCAVLNHHFPSVPNLGDMTKIAEYIRGGYVEAPDLLVGGTPCQAFSVAGARGSLDDERGQLTLEFCKLLDAIDEKREQPAIALWENVQGVLSTKDNAFGCFLGEITGAGAELQPSGKRWSNSGCVFGPKRTAVWRVLDAQYFGVAQRRKRVFVVTSARKDIDVTQVLLEFDGVRRDSAPSRETGQDVARGATSGFASPNQAVGTLCARDIKGVGNQYVGEEKLVLPSDLIVHGTQDPITSVGRNQGQENAVLSGPPAMALSFNSKQLGMGCKENLASTLGASDYKEPQSVLFDAYQHHGYRTGDTCGTLTVGQNNTVRGDSPLVLSQLVRRLTPIECERLQGFPDDWTNIREKCPDGPRYAAIGNSMAVPVMRWIGERIDRLDFKR